MSQRGIETGRKASAMLRSVAIIELGSNEK